MTMASRSVVMLDACHTGETDLFAKAFQGVGASRVLGWDNFAPVPSSSKKSAFFVDRLLGGNKIDAPTPATRPFDVDDAFTHLVGKNLLTATGSYTAHLTLSDGEGGETMLRPSIGQVHPTKIGDDLTIEGNFGADQGTVTVGGSALSCGPWPAADGEPLKHCKLPDGVAGEVVVEVNGIKSPVRHLSRWKGVLVYKQVGPGTLTTEIRFHVDFRGDLLKYRLHEEEDPSKIFDWQPLLADVKKTSCEVILSGSVDTCTQSGGTTFPYSTSPASFCAVGIKFEPNLNGSLPFSFTPTASFQQAGIVTCDGQASPMGATFTSLPGFSDEGAQTFRAEIDPKTGAIKAKKKLLVLAGGQSITYTLEWQNITPEPGTAPSDNDPR